MADGKSITSTFTDRVRQVLFGWWGGIGCRVSFFMMAALVLVTALMGAFFFREGAESVDAEIRGDAFSLARELAALTSDDLLSGNRVRLSRKVSNHVAAHTDPLSRSSLLYIMIYDHACELLSGRDVSAPFINGASHPGPLQAFGAAAWGDPASWCKTLPSNDPFFVMHGNSVYDLTLPVLDGKARVGFVRIGIAGERHEKKFFGIVKKSAVALLGILLAGLAISRIIALGITRPIRRLGEAAEKLSERNWDSPLPVTGTDEVGKLGQTFNRMAQTLKQREASLSRGNRDLFILHTAGLDLMESLDRDALLAKIAARVEDLVRADTTAVSAVDSSDRMLKYLGLYGSRAKAIRERGLILEGGGIYNWLASYGTPLLIADAQADFRLDSALMKELDVKSIMSAPLWSSNTMIGLLTAVNKKGGASFDRHDLRLFTVFSSLAAAALQNASLYSDLKGKMDELKTTQEQLVRSAKMAAIGELSANVAHEINNPLTSVLGYTTHLLKTLDLPEAPRKILGMMEQETLRVRKIIRNLLDFSRQRPSWMQPEDVSVPLRETVAFVRGIADASSVAIRETYPPGPALVNMDQNEIKQVFINIVNNALQAMPQGGELGIRLDASRESAVVVEFSDTGVGIAPESMDKIFQPFFSTKDNGDGTGLGLSISYRIIQNHGGKIEAESMSGKGATFRVFLPRHQGARAVRPAEPAA